jgi:hypothetical protein
MGGNNLLLSTLITSCRAPLEDVYINGTHIPVCWVCTIKQYVWFTLISSYKTAKTFCVCTHAYRTFIYRIIPTTGAICLTDTSLTTTNCLSCTLTSWQERKVVFIVLKWPQDYASQGVSLWFDAWKSNPWYVTHCTQCNWESPPWSN